MKKTTEILVGDDEPDLTQPELHLTALVAEAGGNMGCLWGYGMPVGMCAPGEDAVTLLRSLCTHSHTPRGVPGPHQ